MIKEIEKIVCKGEFITLEELHETNRKGRIVQARQIIMYFASKELGMTSVAIAKHFNKDHGTILSAVNKVSGYIETDSKFRTKIVRYKECLINHKIIKDKSSLEYRLERLKAELSEVIAEIELLKKDINILKA